MTGLLHCDFLDYRTCCESINGTDCPNDLISKYYRRPTGDWKGPGWYRIMQPAGHIIPEKPPLEWYCGAYIPGWMNGIHPSQPGASEEREICFSYGGNTCYWNTTISTFSVSKYPVTIKLFMMVSILVSWEH